MEYKGKKTAWRDVNQADGNNGYIYYINRNHVIDALKHKSSLARYANHARGLTKVKGINNNCEYVSEGYRAYIESVKNIEAGSEILVPYGKEYWDVIRKNELEDEKEAARNAKKASTPKRTRKPLSKKASAKKTVKKSRKK